MVERILDEMILYFKDDVKRVNHALKVFGFASALCGIEGILENEKCTVLLAAILHDIGIKEAERKYNSSSGKYQEIEGPPVARTILAKCGVKEDIIERVCFLVGNHHSYNKIDGVDFQILVEADFLVNIHEDNMKKDTITAIKNNYFKTSGGILFIETIY